MNARLVVPTAQVHDPAPAAPYLLVESGGNVIATSAGWHILIGPGTLASVDVEEVRRAMRYPEGEFLHLTEERPAPNGNFLSPETLRWAYEWYVEVAERLREPASAAVAA